MLTFIAPDQPLNQTREISWDQFFLVFDLHDLALTYEDVERATGSETAFSQLVNNKPRSGSMPHSVRA